jgi:hypothetical protein
VYVCVCVCARNTHENPLYVSLISPSLPLSLTPQHAYTRMIVV